MTITRVFSGYQPTGRLTLGNLLGSIRPAVALQDRAECLYAVVDLHALTVQHDPAALRARTIEAATLLRACGLDRSIGYLQSQVTAHAELAYLLECTAHVGELQRMIQYKQKAGQARVNRVSLLTYPVLMAADILVHRTDLVPVGDDQRQHLELTRDLAVRFNRSYGEVFTVPDGVHPPLAARVMDLAEPTVKMSKSTTSDAGVIHLLDPPEQIRAAVARAVTDSEGQVRYDPDTKPGVSNLLAILSACTGVAPDQVAPSSYRALKAEVAEAVVEMLRPIQDRYRHLAADPADTERFLVDGAARAAELAAPVLAAAQDAIGLVPAGRGLPVYGGVGN
ncbi:MAG: tryptophan--tRNA ligase [Sporichthyaceae bacterium]|nr:tryptophan--tRNA ligase [Sporichthyaceae bacterium]